MEQLTIENFIAAADDLELSQYRILSLLQKYSDLLHKNKLYPSFSDLLELGRILNELITQREEFEKMYPDQSISLSINKSETDEITFSYTHEEVQNVFNLIIWADPQIQRAITEGKAIFDFVEQNMAIQTLGIIPLYRSEGYFIVPDNKEMKNQVYRYEMNLVPGDDEFFRTFKTDLVETSDFAETNAGKPESIKLELIQKFPELPNPALYLIETDLDLPFTETILPIAKRKLVQKLAA